MKKCGICGHPRGWHDWTSIVGIAMLARCRGWQCGCERFVEEGE